MFFSILVYFIHYCTIASVSSLSGIILEDTTFYYRNLGTNPSRLALVEYSVWYNQSLAAGQCSSCYPRLDIYTTRDDTNLHTRCANDNYGQLRNEKLHIALKVQPHDGLCKINKTNTDLVYCDGNVEIPGLYASSLWIFVWV